MPEWVTFLVLAIVAWMLVAVGGGLIVGRLLRLVARHLPHRGRHGA